MDNKHHTDTPGKLLQNLLLEKAVQNKLAYALCADSPFRSIPNASTPPSTNLVRNPFESLIKKRLHQSVISPSLFRTAISNKTEAKFKWAIEDISTLKPVDIDESVMEQFESTENDPDTEILAQATIDKYFNQKHIVPSPFDAIRTVPLISESTSPIKLDEPEKIDESVQTVLTLPPILPQHVEAILQPYFSYTEDQQRESKDSKLYRRLFEFDEQQDSPTSVLSSPAPSFNLSPIECSPIQNGVNPLTLRNFGSDADTLPIPMCNLSPISSCSTNSRSNGTYSYIDFTSRMSIDTSRNWVPDTLDQVPSDNQSLAFEIIHSPVPEALSNSSINWDMEYRHVSFASSDGIEGNLEAEMDVSRSNTPRSKSSSFYRQRKKLSESFSKLKENTDDDYHKENFYDDIKCQSRGNLHSTKDITDAGYHTGVGLTMYEESWSSSHIFASTPSKK